MSSSAAIKGSENDDYIALCTLTSRCTPLAHVMCGMSHSATSGSANLVLAQEATGSSAMLWHISRKYKVTYIRHPKSASTTVVRAIQNHVCEATPCYPEELTKLLPLNVADAQRDAWGTSFSSCAQPMDAPVQRLPYVYRSGPPPVRPHMLQLRPRMLHCRAVPTVLRRACPAFMPCRCITQLCVLYCASTQFNGRCHQLGQGTLLRSDTSLGLDVVVAQDYSHSLPTKPG
jgi:hypothetical protein